ncbi:AAE1, partial [Symbiodinium sp. CCMP2456]
AAAPPAPVLARMADYGIEVSHVYGLTEGYGTGVMCEWKEEWNSKTMEEKAGFLARQGVRCLELEYLDVIDPETRKPVPRDGQTILAGYRIGEIVMSGNTIMKGYFKNPEATAKEFKGGVFNTGDLGVVYPDGYIQLKDRSKDLDSAVVVHVRRGLLMLQMERLNRCLQSPCGVFQAFASFRRMIAGTSADYEGLQGSGMQTVLQGCRGVRACCVARIHTPGVPDLLRHMSLLRRAAVEAVLRQLLWPEALL